MIDIVRGIDRNPNGTEQLIENLQNISDIEGTLYIGYPLSAQTENSKTIDALLISENKGLVAFIFGDHTSNLEEEQDDLYYQLDYTLKKYPQLRKGRGLSFEPIVYTFFSNEVNRIENSEEYRTVSKESLKDQISQLEGIDSSVYKSLVEALQRISTMKPKKKRKNVTSDTSYGGIIKQIELEIANLDEFQKKAAYEFPNGVQRIRGLAGSGKTVVLALKVAYLHSQFPEWDIAVTFYTRSLSQQFKDMIQNFYREFSEDGIDEEKIHIIHAWGNNTEQGIYSDVCKKLGVTPSSFYNAKSKYGQDNAFNGILKDLLNVLPPNMDKMYDMILIDEAQDMPASFFQLCYKILDSKKQLVYAYDELQNLSTKQIPTTQEMFGTTEFGEDKVSLVNKEDEPKKDIVLPICYRNTKWGLTLAHSLGFGLYRGGGDDKVQFFNDSDLWEAIGYELLDGRFRPGERVRLRRKTGSSPAYLSNLLDKNDAVKYFEAFATKEDQYRKIAESIHENITINELDADDILVIFPDTFTAKSEFGLFNEFLQIYNIDSILAGETTDRDTFRISGKVTCSHIYRAKGNESPMVYIVNADYCSDGSDLIKLRNTLFTAITRSRAWVRISGVGSNMRKLNEEIRMCIEQNDYVLDFVVPTPEQIENMRSVHSELSAEEKRNQQTISQLLSKLENFERMGILDDKVKSMLKDLSEQ